MSANKKSSSKGAELTELTETEILEMQDSMSSEWGESAPRKAKAFWPSTLRLAGTFRDHKLGLTIVLAFGLVSTALSV
ncbi:MAG: ABC transporter ATP-binding protein, partial [Brachybacterium sp.]|nr:ABC transporter ATP-binding protein [Brachybacterium sp.]